MLPLIKLAQVLLPFLLGALSVIIVVAGLQAIWLPLAVVGLLGLLYWIYQHQSTHPPAPQRDNDTRGHS